MKPIAIESLEFLTDIESAIVAVNGGSGAALQVPKGSINKHRGAMIDAARLQLLVTWARGAEDSYLQFHAANKLENILSELCSYAPGLTGLRLCDGLRVGDDVVPRRIALQGAIDKMESMDAGKLNEIIGGRSIDLISVSGAQLQYISPLFYARDPRAVRDKDGMHILLSRIFEQINKNDQGLIPESFVKACSIFTSELFRNTQEHAIHNHIGEPYGAHVEGLIVSWSNMEDRLFSSDFEGHKRLKSFWDRETIPVDKGSHKALRCLQLSFFDSGPGFASRATGKNIKDLDIQVEREELINCLKKNVTTKHQVGAGQGLPGVLSELKALGGLIRIRSGRHSIFNCFSLDEDEDIFNFSDWSDEDLGSASGTVISLLVPLRRK